MAAEPAYAPVTNQLIDELRGVVGERLSTAATPHFSFHKARRL